MPSEMSLKKVAPEKSFEDAYQPMNFLKESIDDHRSQSTALVKSKHLPSYVPAGQSTQMVIGASPETDQHILKLATTLYDQQSLKRVYYSGYVPISEDERLPTLSAPPLRRENRLYQADWLMRFYGFRADEIVDDANPMLDPDVDPKLAFALRNPHLFPVDINKAPLEMILRVPGLGVKSAHKIVNTRRFRPIRREHLKKIGVVWKRAQYFIITADNDFRQLGFDPQVIRRRVLHERSPKGRHVDTGQMSLFG